MQGDFTRVTFDKTHNFSRVLMQQGRVQLDDDFNLQAAILLHYLRTLAADLGGPAWGPAGNLGFELSLSQADDGNFTIGPGRYYVDGFLVENHSEVKYLDQTSWRDLSDKYRKERLPAEDKSYYAYLDVWERHITHVQDERIRETALGGPDTCTRAQVVWQVKLYEVPDGDTTDDDTEQDINTKKDELAKLQKLWESETDAWAKLQLEPSIFELIKELDELDELQNSGCAGAATYVRALPKISSATLKARLQPEPGNDDACSIPPESRYRGMENQLYRIEVHREGEAEEATFKWSRDNGSVVFPIVEQQGGAVTLQSLGSDPRTSLQVGDWVEIMDDGLELRGALGILAQVDTVDLVEMAVTLKPPAGVSPTWPSYDEKSTNHPLLRRWDHSVVEGVVMSEGTILITESNAADDGWIEIESGIEVQFQPGGEYHTGDYWLVPARVATGKIEWPTTHGADGNEIPKEVAPHGIEHHYAPLGVIVNRTVQHKCRCTLTLNLDCTDPMEGDE